MHIALLTDGIYPYVIGGMQKHSFYLAKFFAANKINISLYHTAENLEEAKQLNCFTEEEKKFIEPILISFPKLDNYPGHYIREMFAYSESIYTLLITKNTADFIYVQGMCGMKLLEKKHMIHTPIGINLHGLEMFQKAANLKSRAEQYLFRSPVLKMLRKADVVFSLGHKLTELLISKKIPKSRIIQLPIGIDKGWVIQKNEIRNRSTITFIFVGRFERRKGIIELSKAIKQLKVNQFEFHFIGYVPENEKVKSSNIHYWGALSDVEKIKKLYQQSDVLVCPSYSEGMPTVILEAMASGLAVIASNVGAVSEQVSDKNGILIAPGNTDQLKNALLKFIGMPEKELLQMKESSIAKIQNHFLWNTIIKNTISEIQQVADKKRQETDMQTYS